MKSPNKNFQFSIYSESDLQLSKRAGEIKIGERVLLGNDTKLAKFVVLGISDDIGPQMNHGQAGAKNGFAAAIQKLCGTQSNVFLNGSEIGILGEITQNCAFKSIKDSKGIVEELDEFVFEVLCHHVAKEQTLIVIGGGHNNALPLLRYAQFINKAPVFAVNIDPHADCRKTDYRHSGNPFSYAKEEEVLCDYALYGLHENYNNNDILDFINENGIRRWTYEQHLDSQEETLSDFFEFVNTNKKKAPCTLDIDMDSIAFMPSSAFTPSGLDIETTRRMVRKLAKTRTFSHLHLPECAPANAAEIAWTGKLLSYLIIDFIKGQNRLS